MEIPGQTDVQDQVLPRQSGSQRDGRQRCPVLGQGGLRAQASVIPILWELRIRKEERRRCPDVAGDAAGAGGGLGFELCFLFPFYCSL